MKKNIFLSIFLIYILCAFVGALFQASTVMAASLEAEIQKTYQHIHTMQTSFDQRLTHRESGAVEERQGTLLFQKPLLVRWETRRPHEELLLITDKEIWNYLPDEELAYTYTADLIKDSRTLIEVITGQARLDKDFAVRNMGKEGGFEKLQLFPKEPSPEMVEAVIWVDSTTKLIHKARIIDFYGNSNELRFTAIKKNVDLPAGSFSFIPPKGTDIENGANR